MAYLGGAIGSANPFDNRTMLAQWWAQGFIDAEAGELAEYE